MSDKNKLRILALIFLAVGIPSILFLILSPDVVVLRPKGMIGEKQKSLLTTTTLLMLIVVIPVFFMTFAIAWKYRASNEKAKYRPNWDYNLLAESLWWGVPCLIIIALAILNWKGCFELDPFRPLAPKEEQMTIQAVALDWKWLFIYPEEKIATINFVQFPENTPIHFEITADAPMNSFWIPQLAGQVYAMAGMKSELHLIANEVGSFRGSSANISGEGFSGMTFTAKASSQEEFETWVKNIQGSAQPLNQTIYEQLVEPSVYQPAAFYSLEEEELFESIMKKYME